MNPVKPNMDFFTQFIKSGQHFYFVSASYLIVFFLLMLIFIINFKRVKKLEKRLNEILKNETKK